MFNPADWEAVELAATQQYAANSSTRAPVDRAARRLWGVNWEVGLRAPPLDRGAPLGRDRVHQGLAGLGPVQGRAERLRLAAAGQRRARDPAPTAGL